MRYKQIQPFCPFCGLVSRAKSFVDFHEILCARCLQKNVKREWVPLKSSYWVSQSWGRVFLFGLSLFLDWFRRGFRSSMCSARYTCVTFRSYFCTLVAILWIAFITLCFQKNALSGRECHEVHEYVVQSCAAYWRFGQRRTAYTTVVP